MFLIDRFMNGEVKKPTVLVHYERNISITAQKLITLLVFHIQISEKEKDEFYYIHKRFVRRFITGENNDSASINNAFLELWEKGDFKWNILDKDYAFKNLMCKFLISLAPPNNGHYYGFQIHPNLELLIKNPRLFSTERIIMMAILTRQRYAYPLYDLLLDAYSRKEKVLKISLEHLKDCLGISEESYKKDIFHDYVGFKKSVLKPLLKVLDKKTDIYATIKTYRKNRRVAGIYFYIEKRKFHQTPITGILKDEIKKYYESEFSKDDLVLLGQKNEKFSQKEKEFIEDVSREFKVHEDAIKNSIKNFGLQGVIEIKEYSLAQNKKTPKEDLSAYMAKCFNKGYGVKTHDEREKEKEKQKRAEERKAKAQKEKINKEILYKLEIDFSKVKNEKREKAEKKLTKAERDIFEKEFLDTSNKFAVSQFKRGNMLSFNFFMEKRLLKPEDLDFSIFACKKGYEAKKNKDGKFEIVGKINNK